MKNYFIVLFTFISISKNFAQSWEFSIKDTANVFSEMKNNPDVSQNLGESVAIYGDYAVVSAADHSYDENNSKQLKSAGAVFVYQRNNGEWKRSQKIVSTERDSLVRFGASVSLNKTILAVGAPGKNAGALKKAGSVCIYMLENNNWVQKQCITVTKAAANDKFGYQVRLSDDFLFISSMGTESGLIKNKAASSAGAVYVYKLTNGNFSYVQTLIAPLPVKDGAFGISVDQSKDKLIVGSPGDDLDATNKNKLKGAGSAYVFSLKDNKWTFMQKLISPNRTKAESQSDLFGGTVAINNNYVVIAAKGYRQIYTVKNYLQAGLVYVYQIENGKCVFKQTVAPDKTFSSPALFGTSLALNDNYLVVGSPQEKIDIYGVNSELHAGLVFLYGIKNNRFELLQKLQNANMKPYDFFGNALSMDKSTSNLVIAAKNQMAIKDSNDPYKKLQKGSVSFFNFDPCAYMQFEERRFCLVQNEEYKRQINIWGGNNLKFTVSKGSLPTGITLTESGVLKGKASQTGNTFKFSITAKDGNCSVTKDFDSQNFNVLTTDQNKSEVIIGDKKWSAKNLNVIVFNNGDSIPLARSNEEWKNAAKNKKPAYCYFENNPENASEYGVLYNFYAVSDPRGITPKGWHVPSKEEWENLDEKFSKLHNLKSTFGWNQGKNGDNSSGFSIYPYGYRSEDNAGFYGLNEDTFFWTTSQVENSSSIYGIAISDHMKFKFRGRYDKGCGFYIRCIKD